MNNFFEVDLGSKRIVLRQPIVGGTGMYTKKTILTHHKNNNHESIETERALDLILKLQQAGAKSKSSIQTHPMR